MKWMLGILIVLLIFPSCECNEKEKDSNKEIATSTVISATAEQIIQPRDSHEEPKINNSLKSANTVNDEENRLGKHE